VRRHSAALLAVALAGIVGFVACGGGDDDGISPADVQGNWAGTTSQDKAITFTVNTSGVTAAVFTYQMTGKCTFTSTLPITTTSALGITDGNFDTGKTQIGSGVFLTATGEFTSSTTATGTLLIQDAPCADTLNLTWTATKQ
jgi:hypothetical protein